MYYFLSRLFFFISVQPNNDLEKKIIEAFEVFDHSGKQVVDVREIGTILRSLGKCLAVNVNNSYFSRDVKLLEVLSWVIVI